MQIGELSAEQLRTVLTIKAGEIEGPGAARGVLAQVRHHLRDDGTRTARVVLEGAGQLTRFEFDAEREVAVSPWEWDPPDLDQDDNRVVDVD